MTIERPLRGSDLGMRHILTALGSKHDAAALLHHMASISRPGEGASKVLVLFARMLHADWLRGNLVVELVADGVATAIEVVVEVNGRREPLFPLAHFHAPIDEFLAAIERHRALLAPLLVRRRDSARIVLATGLERVEREISRPALGQNGRIQTRDYELAKERE